jgi:hypothetical protein
MATHHDNAGGRSSTTIRTPHLSNLTAALDERDCRYEVVGSDRVRVHDVAPDDLGWLAASEGVVIYEMSTDAQT